MHLAAKNISYIKPLEYNGPSYIAIHIKCTDKLHNRGKDEFTRVYFNEMLQKTVTNIDHIVATGSIQLTIVADDPQYKTYMIDKIHKDVIIL
jgi:hypothetical protein